MFQLLAGEAANKVKAVIIYAYMYLPKVDVLYIVFVAPNTDANVNVAEATVPVAGPKTLQPSHHSPS